MRGSAAFPQALFMGAPGKTVCAGLRIRGYCPYTVFANHRVHSPQIHVQSSGAKTTHLPVMPPVRRCEHWANGRAWQSKRSGCRGRGIGEHNRRKAVCKTCSGNCLCEHGRQRHQCTLCPGFIGPAACRYIGATFRAYCRRQNVVIEEVPSYTHTFNARAEGAVRICKDKVRAFLRRANMPRFWPDALLHWWA